MRMGWARPFHGYVQHVGAGTIVCILALLPQSVGETWPTVIKLECGLYTVGYQPQGCRPLNGTTGCSYFISCFSTAMNSVTVKNVL